MTSPTQIVGVFFLLMALYWTSYVWFRPRLARAARFNHALFLANLLLMLVIILVYQSWIIVRLDITSSFLVATTIIMTLAAILHHLSILAHKRAIRYPFIEKIHGPISHTLFFVPFAINSAIVSAALGALSTSWGDILMVGLFMTVSIGSAIKGVRVGLQKELYVISKSLG